MGIYERDYSKLTKEEVAFLDKIKSDKKFSTIHRVIPYSTYPKAVRHYKSLFPNHHLDIFDLKGNEKPKEQIELFLKTLNDSTITERNLFKIFLKNLEHILLSVPS
ncbi:hypothetical protein ACT7DL_07520 [Bacillus paranthracis]